MAGDWIKMRSNLWDDPRVTMMADLTESSEAAIVGALYWLWATADQHSNDGVMLGLTLRALDRKTGVDGFGGALVAVGWLVEQAGGVEIIRFSDHNGESAKSRVQTARRVANHKTNAKVTPSALPEQQTSVTTALPREREREELTTSIPDGIDAASGAVDQLPSPGKLECPHQAIVALYHEVLPQCPSIREWTPARATQLRARWSEDPKRQDLTYWRKFFEYVGTCDFLVGRTSKPFFADLEWMTKSQNFTRIRERKYENRGRQ